MPLMPFLFVRKFSVAGLKDTNKVISSGMAVKSKTVNALFAVLSKCEWLPQHFAGSSLMAVLEC